MPSLAFQLKLDAQRLYVHLRRFNIAMSVCYLQENYNTLHLACMYSREDTVKLLLLRGNLSRRPSATSVMAVSSDQATDTRMTHNIDLNAQGGAKKQTYVHLACGRKSSGSLAVLKELLRLNFAGKKDSRLRVDADKNIPLFVAIEAGNVTICKELLAQFTEEQLKYLKVKPTSP